MDIEEKVRCGVAKRASRSGLAKTALRASTLTALALLLALAMLLPNAAAEAQSSPLTATATSTATVTATATPTDYDTDDDGLIDINTLAQLNAVRYDLNGDGKQGTASAADWAIYTAAFSNPASGMGCKLDDHDDDATTDTQPTCKGYELMADLDFDTDGDGDVDSSDTYPNWTPIGTEAKPFESRFEGNLTNGVMPKISNLTITSISGSSVEAGLFGATQIGAHIKNIGLVDVDIDITTSSGYADIGALVGYSLGNITACYSTGAITAAAGSYSTAGGLAGYNGRAMAASFSRATVDMSTNNALYAGGLVGYNGGTIRATYAAGAVKGKGNNTGYVGGLVGYNLLNIEASYSIAPVTAVASVAGGSKPHLHGLNNSVTEGGFGRVTASYWDHVSSGIIADGAKSTHDLMSPTGYTGIYADWDDLTIDGANDVDPWDFSRADQHPQLKYGGHTIELAGNQRFASIKIGNQLVVSKPGRNAIHPTEGMTIIAGGASGNWIWERSVDGIDWATLSPLPDEESQALRSSVPTYQFVPRLEHVGKYIRAKILLTTGDFVSRPIGKIKVAPINDPVGFASGHNPPRIGTPITVGRSGLQYGASSVVGLWYRCYTQDASGCELVGSRSSYIPGSADVGHYIYARIYYYSLAKTPGVTIGDDGQIIPPPSYIPDHHWRYSPTGFTPQRVVGVSQWRRAGE